MKNFINFFVIIDYVDSLILTTCLQEINLKFTCYKYFKVLISFLILMLNYVLLEQYRAIKLTIIYAFMSTRLNEVYKYYIF